MMDPLSESAWSQVCDCGRTFSSPQAYSCHKRTCQKTKKRLSSVLARAKEVWQSRKHRKVEDIVDTQEAPEHPFRMAVTPDLQVAPGPTQDVGLDEPDTEV
jgi:hypothetical protein